MVLCKYLPRAQEGKEKKARTKTNQHYPVRALFFSEEKKIKTWKSKREGNKTDWLKFGDFPS